MPVYLQSPVRAGGGHLAAVHLRAPDQTARARLRAALDSRGRIDPANAPALAAPLAYITHLVLDRLSLTDKRRLARALERAAKGERMGGMSGRRG